MYVWPQTCALYVIVCSFNFSKYIPYGHVACPVVSDVAKLDMFNIAT